VVPVEQFSVTLAKVAEESNLTVAYTPKDLKQIKVFTAEVYRPGIMLAGYYQYFDRTRIQILGLTEMSYLKELEPALRRTHLEKLFSFVPPAVIVSHDVQPLPEMLEFAQQYAVPLLVSAENTSTLMSTLITTLNVELAPRITRHGVLVEVYGEGILILGDSGVGKSETAIELVKRGHRLIADDAVELRKVSSRRVMGTAPENIRHFIELRGIGIINVARLFGIGAVKDNVEIELVVVLEPWDRTKNYDRTGLETESYDILGVKVPSMLIPVMPGRNLAVILETAAMNNRQKRMGYNAAQELLENLGLKNDISL
jgi:HPr kinase/phosphorylase